jgi:hypothetical protein
VETLDRALCRAGGLNHNFKSGSGTPCHVQIEDYGPVVDRTSEQEVRRLNVIVYAGYGTPKARIVFGRNFDYPDVRTREYNETIKDTMGELVVQAQAELEQMEQRELACLRVWFTGRGASSDDELREEFQEFHELYPTLWKRALGELRSGAIPIAPPVRVAAKVEPPPPAAPADIAYPMDAERRRRVIEIEGVIATLGQDLGRLKAEGGAYDLLLQRADRLVSKARETLGARHSSGDVDLRLLDITLDNLGKLSRQVRSLLAQPPR